MMPDSEDTKTVKSLSVMLGWSNVPPREVLERDIRALKARAEESTGLQKKLKEAQSRYVAVIGNGVALRNDEIEAVLEAYGRARFNEGNASGRGAGTKERAAHAEADAALNRLRQLLANVRSQENTSLRKELKETRARMQATIDLLDGQLNAPQGGGSVAAISPNQIEYMVQRFLAWKLPANFAPDAGISFKATYNEHTPWPAKHEPIGTNLFDATQTQAMVLHMVDGLPASDKDAVDRQQNAHALHASAPAGQKCADCTMDKEPCPACYSAWWHKKHPHTRHLGGCDHCDAASDKPVRQLPEEEALVITEARTVAAMLVSAMEQRSLNTLILEPALRQLLHAIELLDANKPVNQCDGCRAGIPVDENGNHRIGEPGGYSNLQACEKDKYLK
jgi:hypothetical protein